MVDRVKSQFYGHDPPQHIVFSDNKNKKTKCGTSKSTKIAKRNNN